MEVELRMNGALELRLTPRNAVETAVLDEMQRLADLGRPVKLVRGGEGSAVVSVEAK